MVKDPVCGMTIDKEKSAGKIEYQGKVYYFCSPGCKKTFEKNPEAYADKKYSVDVKNVSYQDSIIRKKSFWISIVTIFIISLLHYNTTDESIFRGVSARLYYIPIIYSALLGGIWAGIYTSLLSVFLHLGIMVPHFTHTNIYGFQAFEHLLDLPFYVLAGVVTGSLVTIKTKHKEEKNRIESMFKSYVTPEIVQHIISQGEAPLLSGVKKKVTILFADIRGFTSLSEKIDPELVVELLDEYFTVMTNIAFEYKATIDKFIGDCVMLLFGTPISNTDDAERAINTAIKMQRGFATLKEHWYKKHNLEKNIGLGIGVNTGEAVIGNIGSNIRMDYTAIGDAVNFSARLCSLASDREIIISDSTYKEIALNLASKFGKREPISIKGKENLQEIYSYKLE